MLTLADVVQAAGRLRGVAHRTPVLTSATLDDLTGARVLCKAENLQRVGAFKFRGAFNALAAMDETTRSRGVVTYSSGNHGQAIALAARLHEVEATVVMPTDAPPIKMAAVAGYGASIVSYDRVHGDRETIASQIAADSGAVIVPPFNDWNVMAGQGTVGLELIEAHPDVETLVVCVGGGGLIAGCATVAKAHGAIRLIGVEPEAGDDVKQSLAAGSVVTIPQPNTIADGQATTAPGDKTFSVIKECVDEIVTVSDHELVAAMVFAFERMKTVLEPSGASALAAVLSGKIDASRGGVIGLTFSGGNVDASRFAELVG